MFYDFKFESKYLKMLEEVSVNAESVLRDAGIPPRVINNENYRLDSEQYKKVLESFDRQVDIDRLVSFSTLESVNVFVPEFFAGLCADNGLKCINRIAKYKKIIAPVTMVVETRKDTTSILYKYSDGEKLPRAILVNAHINILSIIRQGTGIDNISPITILTEYEYPKSIINYIGIKPQLSHENKIIFSNEDLKKPFITENNRMWAYLKKELNERLEEMEIDNSFSALVRKTLFELIPSGVSDMDKIAYELGMSKRTLGRRLKEEGTTYKAQLNHTRELLVCNYLKRDMSLNEIAFLVNYLDTKSLSRAFKTWTGMSVTEYKNKMVG